MLNYMTQQDQPLSQVVPVLVAVLVCDAACTDRSTGKHTLVGLFDRIFVAQFPTRRPISLFMRLTDAAGYYKVEIRYAQLTSGKVLAKVEGELQAEDRLKSSTLLIDFPPLSIPEEGRYEFQIWANNMFLGSTVVDAVPRKLPEKQA